MLALQLGLLAVNLDLRVIDLDLRVIDLGDGALLLERQRLELLGELVELGFDCGELVLGRRERVERLLRGARVDLGDGALLLERQRLELLGELVELGFDCGELVLGRRERVERLLRGARGMRALGEAEQRGRSGEHEGRLERVPARDGGAAGLVDKGGVSALRTLGLKGGRGVIVRHGCSVCWCE